MSPLGSFVPQSAMQQDLNRRVRQMFFGANDVRDFQRCIVHDSCKVIERRSVTASHHWVRHQAAVPFNLASYMIVDCHFVGTRNQQTNNKRLSVSDEFFCFVFGQCQRRTAADVDSLFFLRRFALGLSVLRNFKVSIGLAGIQQLVQSCVVQVAPLRLKVRSVWSTDFRAFVPVEPQPAEGIQNRPKRGVNISLLIGVVNSQNKLTTIVACPQPAKKGGTHPADVHITGRAGGKTSSNGHRKFSDKFPSHRDLVWRTRQCGS